MAVAAEGLSGMRHKAATIQFSTHQVPRAERRSAWDETMTGFCGPTITDFGSGDFEGRFEVRRASGFGCARVRQNARTTRRSMRELARADTGFFYLVLQTMGTSTYQQDDGQADLRAGDMTLIDAARPSTILFGNGSLGSPGSEHLCLHVPREQLERRLGGQRLRLASAVRGAPAMVMGSLLRPAFSEQHAFNAQQTDAIGDALLQIVTASWAFSDDTAAARSAHEQGALGAPLLTMIHDYLHSNLASDGLSPQAIADAHGISVRHVHRLFAAAGTTLGEWLRVARLERCAADLRDRTQSGTSITEIAFRWGFNESAHFSRSFKAHFGSAPRDYRSAFFSQCHPLAA